MRITVLAENTSSCSLPSEHGLSLYIEAVGKKLLFDSGQSGLFADNAARLGVELGAVDLAVLSHGHYDHGGGMKRFLELNRTAKLYINRSAFGKFYNADNKYIGLDASLLRSDRVILTDGVTSLGRGLTLYDASDVETVVDLGAFGLTTERDGKRIPDDFRHEQYLLIEENDRRILFSGCSHKGIFNIIEHFRPDVLIGGFHFMKLPLDDTLTAYAKRLDSYDIDLYTCHCTGIEQFEAMRPYMRRLHYLSTGEKLELDNH